MSRTRRSPPTKRRHHRLVRLERVLWVIGFTALGWTGLVWADGALYQAAGEQRWSSGPVVVAPTPVPDPVALDEARQKRPGTPRSAPPRPADEGPPPASAARPALPGDRASDGDEGASDAKLDRLLRQAASLLPERETVGRLEVPRLGLSVVVGEGESHRTLSRGAALLAGSPRPGMPGNVAIAGHRDRHFRPLEGIRSGDEILFIGADGTRRYRVEWTRVVDPHDVEVLAATSHPSLTLVTCFPFRYVGTAPERFIVRAVEVAGGATAPDTLPILPL